MMRIPAALLVLPMLIFSGCAHDTRAVPDENGVYPAEKLFDYFFSDDMPWGETKEFEVPEFSDVKFIWSDLSVGSIKDGEKAGLYWGMPVWGVYLADLNGDGKREICSTVSMGSGIVDERVYVYDYANGKLYELEDRFHYNYRLELRDGVLMYVKYPEPTPANSNLEEITEPLTLEKMTEVDEVRI